MPSPPLFVGINLPNATGMSDPVVVESAISHGYDMITSRITSRAYRKRVQSLFEELAVKMAAASSGSVNSMFSRGSPSIGSSSPLLDGAASAVAAAQSSPSLSKRATETSSPHSTSHPFSTSTAPQVPAPTLDDVVIHPGPHISNTVALASPWIEIDSKYPQLADISLQVLQHEIVYAAFVGLTHVVVPSPKRRTQLGQFAQAINMLLARAPYLKIAIHMPFREEPGGGDELSLWDVWNTVRSLCGSPRNLTLALQVPAELPPRHVLLRWFCEPVSILVVSSKTFIANPKGFPVLTKGLQELLLRFFTRTPGPPFVVIDDDGSSSSNFNGGPESYLLYLRHLYSVVPAPSKIESFASGMVDCLQQPLQPLADNLESATYEVFERDTVKYELYERALYAAIIDLAPTSGRRVSIAVLGAGRGPLVDRVLSAALSADREVDIVALEKNPSAYVLLCRRKVQDWKHDNVTVYQGDMRTWTTSLTFDIIVTELLGSFGDNELAPECLDGAQRLLSDTGIMIPSSYSAHLTPVMSPKLHALALANDKTNSLAVPNSSTPGPRAISEPSSLHTPYVVLMQQFDRLSDSVGQVWSWSHPQAISDNGNRHNTRRAKETFVVPYKAVMHGFAGYFEAVLYGNIELSTRPDTCEQKSKDMVSWFPIWFPLAQPIYVCDNSEIDVCIARLTDGMRVWYEWSVEAFAISPVSAADGRMSLDSAGSVRTSRRIRTATSEIHNPGGRHYAMTL